MFDTDNDDGYSFPADGEQPFRFDFLSLPAELKRRTAYFLATHDVTRLSQTCHALHHSLVLRRLQPPRSLPLPPPPNPHDETFTLRRIPARLPVWNKRVHSLTLRVQHVQQNAMQRTVSLYVSAYPSATSTARAPPRILRGADADDDNNGTNNPNGNNSNNTTGGALGRIVGSSSSLWGRTTPINQPETWQCTFCPQSEGEMYYVWYASRSVFITGLQLETRILDDPTGVVSRQYTKLSNLGVFCGNNDYNSGTSRMFHNNPPLQPTLFYPQLLLHVARSLRQGLSMNTTTTTSPSTPATDNCNTSTTNENNNNTLFPNTVAAASSTRSPSPSLLAAIPLSLLQFWQQQSGLSIDPLDLAALEEILQSDLEERQWRLLEQSEALTMGDDDDDDDNNMDDHGQQQQQQQQPRPRRQGDGNAP